MSVNDYATSNFQKQMGIDVRKGNRRLRVVNTGKGYRLGAERPQSVVLFGPTYSKEGKAVMIGLERYKQKASRLLKKAA